MPFEAQDELALPKPVDSSARWPQQLLRSSRNRHIPGITFSSPRMTNIKIGHPVLFPISVLLVPFLGLCTLFALVATTAEAWQEHAQSQWPQVTATVINCGLNRSNTRQRSTYYIRCHLSYAIGTEQNASTVHSGYAPSREVWQYPRNQIEPLETWVERHPPGTQLAVRYDLANHRRILIASDYMPLAGPRTPTNLKLLAFAAASFVAALAIAWLTRPASGWRQQTSSVPLAR
jgi:Protein of unknown function (DUF3592)